MAPFTSRRKFILQSGKAGLGLYAGSACLSSYSGMNNATPDQYFLRFQQEPLPYSYDALKEAIDATTMEIHYTKHAAAYATNLQNAAKKEGIDTSKPVEDVLRNVS